MTFDLVEDLGANGLVILQAFSLNESEGTSEGANGDTFKR